eukprot:4960774-Amphidinium_carterae.2
MGAQPRWVKPMPLVEHCDQDLICAFLVDCRVPVDGFHNHGSQRQSVSRFHSWANRHPAKGGDCCSAG